MSHLEEIYQRGLEALELFYGDETPEKKTQAPELYTEPIKLRIPKRKRPEK